MAAKGRIKYLDLFRYLVVTAAIVSHIVGRHSLYNEHADLSGLFAKALTRGASPALLVLFGMMVEIVYAKRYAISRREASVNLIHRAFLCYLAVAAIATVALVAGNIPPARYVGAMLFIAPVANNDIFKIYALLLIAMIPFLFVRIRFGAFGVMTFACIVWLIHFFALSWFPPLPYPFQHIGSLTIGVGEEFGPTVLHSFILIAFGMAVADIVTSPSRDARWLLVAATLAAAAVATLAFYILRDGIVEVAENIAFMERWRNQHHFGYYSYGIAASCILLVIAYGLSKVLPSRVSGVFEIVGGSTLMYFFSANLIISMMPDLDLNISGATAVVIVGYITLFTILTYVWALHGKSAKIVVGFNRTVKDVIRKALAAVSSDTALAARIP